VKLNYLLIGMAFIVPQVSNATETVTVELFCDKTQKVFETLKNEHGESPMIMGQTHDRANSTMSLWINPVTGTWTILATVQNVTCVVGGGSKVQEVSAKKYMNF
jgi:hypothetical protein